MIPLDIDLSELIEEFELTADQALGLGSEIIDRIVAEYTTKWENLVDNGLQQTRTLYKKAMYVDRVSPTEVVFGLAAGDDGLALAIEEGKEAYDEKPFFAASSKRKQSIGGGWYLTIPFRYATPGAVAEAGMFKGVLPNEIYDISRSNKGKPIKGSQLPEPYNRVGSRKEIETARGIIPEYIHKAPKFQGLVRINIASTDKEKRGGYFTFRRVSNNSDPNSWIHPGFEARKFMDKALDESQIDTVADMAIDNFLSQL